MHDLTPIIVNLRRDDAPETLLAALSATRPWSWLPGLGQTNHWNGEPAQGRSFATPCP